MTSLVSHPLLSPPHRVGGPPGGRVVVPARRAARAYATGTAGFTLIELLTVIAIIAILTTITIPAIRSLTKSNDQSQGANLVRSMITNARAIAISQHRMAGIVFFEETPAFSLPVHRTQTAMQILVEAYDQSAYASGITGFSYYNTARQYLPDGVKLAALTDFAGSNVETGDATTFTNARAILFDANGQLVLRKSLATADPGPGGVNQGTYPAAFGDWQFLRPNGTRIDGVALNADLSNCPSSSPGFFLYNKAEFDAFTGNRVAWLKQNSSTVIVNGNTGGVLK